MAHIDHVHDIPERQQPIGIQDNHFLTVVVVELPQPAFEIHPGNIFAVDLQQGPLLPRVEHLHDN